MSTSDSDSELVQFGSHFQRFVRLADTLGPSLADGSRLLGAARRCERTVFVGARGGEGCTTMSSCAAISLARSSGNSVLWVEGDVFQPSMVTRLGAEPGLGVQAVLEGRSTLPQAVQRTDVPGLSVLGNGVLTPDSARWPTAVQWQWILDSAAAQYDHLVVDAPALLTLPATRGLAAACTRAVLVARAGKSTRSDLVDLTKVLRSNGLRVVGTVLNRVR